MYFLKFNLIDWYYNIILILAMIISLTVCNQDNKIGQLDTEIYNNNNNNNNNNKGSLVTMNKTSTNNTTIGNKRSKDSSRKSSKSFS
jgi:hypothetical protein